MVERGDLEKDKFIEEYPGKTRVRTGLVDSNGNPITPSNPLPVQNDGDFAINVQLDSGDSNVEYIGKAAIGTLTSAASWQIRKVDINTGTVITYADGDEEFNNIFDNREALSYS